MSRLPLGEQIKGMKADWPMFKVKNVSANQSTARWVGTVKPHLVAYKLEIWLKRGWPEARIRSPELTRLPDNSEGQLPHIYPPADDPTLCLFDPRADEWNPSMLISRTIVPWAIDWIACYEFWLMTGRWEGGGRHPSVSENLPEGAF